MSKKNSRVGKIQKKSGKAAKDLLKKAQKSLKESCLSKTQSLKVQAIILKGFNDGCTDDEIAKRIDDEFLPKVSTDKTTSICEKVLENNDYVREG